MVYFEFLLFLLAPFAIGSIPLLREFLQRRRRLRDWREAADACGLQILEESLWGPRLKAQAGQLAVTFEWSGGDSRIVVRGPVPSSLYNVRIRREPLLRRTPEIEIGDPSFDRTFLIEGPPQEVLALLDARLRDLMTRANLECRLQISTGLLQADLADKNLLFFLHFLLDIGRKLAEPFDTVERLAENARSDPEAGVRLQNLLLLIRELPGEPATAEAIRRACSDPSPLVRLRAAQALGAEGRGLVRDLAESLADDAVSAEAVSILKGELSFERTKAILDRAQDRSLPRTAHACLEALGEKGASPGQLSLDGTEAGQLALATDEAGQLSLAPEAAGNLSLPQAESGPFDLPSEEPGPLPQREREGPGGRRG
jgi:hypothetical protein